MDARHLKFGLLACLVIAGCQSGGNTELMERELRLQEDRIYYLEDELARCCKAMQECQQGDAPVPPNGPSTPRRPSTQPAPGPGGDLPKVELEMPAVPQPGPVDSGPGPAINQMPSLFEPPTPAALSQREPPTALRIVKPRDSHANAADVKLPSVEASDEPRGPVRMRFATAAEDWSLAERAAAASQASPRTAAGSGTPSRPQWSPYR